MRLDHLLSREKREGEYLGRSARERILSNILRSIGPEETTGLERADKKREERKAANSAARVERRKPESARGRRAACFFPHVSF